MKSLLLLLVCLSCVRQETETSAEKGEVVVKTCEVSASIDNLSDPQSIEELITLINALPKPLTADCLIKSLKRPLYVNATSSTLSVQPADSQSSPRIFIFKGDLIISLVPTGEGSKVLEFSEMTSSMRSIKGEVNLPIEKNLSPSEPFSKINNYNQTSCSGCHTSERMEYQVEGVPVYSSVAFRPTESRDVSVDTLKEYQQVCQVQKNSHERCLVLNALFSEGEVIPKAFSEDLTFFLSTFLR